jgi:FMN phosphatase YigB (HAD superfamily)
MKLLFDFDGVLTEQTEEADRVLEIFREEIARVVGAEATEVSAEIERASAAIAAAPHKHGWVSHGRVSAYANEDLFIRNNGLAACLDGLAESGDERLAGWRRRLAADGRPDFMSLAQLAYDRMTGETMAGAMKPMEPGGANILKGLLDDGHKIVVVSNSGTTRIVALLRGAGLDAVEHAVDPAAALRIRGGARKFELTPESRRFDVGAYRVETGRPVYEAILREEKPQFAVGDVFSLDLALPLHLARTDPDFRGLRIALRVRGYTPDWSRDFARRYNASAHDGHASLHLVHDLAEIPEILKN